MSALYTALVEGETKESLARMVVNLRAALRMAAVVIDAQEDLMLKHNEALLTALRKAEPTARRIRAAIAAELDAVGRNGSDGQ